MPRFVVLAMFLVSCQTARLDPGAPDDDGGGGGRDAATNDAGDAATSDPDAGDEPDAGTDAGPTTPCHGQAPACWGRDFAACAIGLGCTSRPICVGTAFACVHLVDEASCVAQAGCSWNGGKCGGRQTPCNQLDPATTCDEQSGCAATIACEGRITACSAIPDETTCLSQAGCAWDGSLASTIR